MNVPERTNEQMNGQTNEWNGRNAGSHSPCSLVLQLDFIANKYIICRNVISSISFCCSVDMLAIHNGDNVNQAPFNILLVIWLFFVSFLGGAAIQLYSIFFTPNFKWSNYEVWSWAICFRVCCDFIMKARFSLEIVWIHAFFTFL